MNRYLILFCTILVISIFSGCINPNEDEAESLAEELDQFEFIIKLECHIDTENDILEFSKYSPEFIWNDYLVRVWNSSGIGYIEDSDIDLEIVQEFESNQRIRYGADEWDPYTGEEYVVMIAHIGWNKEMRRMVVTAS